MIYITESDATRTVCMYVTYFTQVGLWDHFFMEKVFC